MDLELLDEEVSFEILKILSISLTVSSFGDESKDPGFGKFL